MDAHDGSCSGETRWPADDTAECRCLESRLVLMDESAPALNTAS